MLCSGCCLPAWAAWKAGCWPRQVRAASRPPGGVLAVASGEIKLSWVRADLAGRVGAVSIDSNDARQLGLGYVHNLSRRTVLYTTWSRIDNRGAAIYVVPGGPAGIVGGQKSTGYEAGLRHTF